MNLPGGLWPVMLTPFKKNGSIDYVALDDLVDFYVENGANGLFANCLSSEMYDLSLKEQIKVVKRVIKRVGEKIPVVASCTFSEKPDKGEEINDIYETGVKAVVLITSLLAEENEDDVVFKNNLFEILSNTGNIPLGLYECPVPYKRLIGSELLGELARTDRFVYFKDTSCNSEMIIDRLKNISSTGLNLYNANTPTAMDSVLFGASGFSPISANFFPELYARLYKLLTIDKDHAKAARLQDYLSLMDGLTRIKYPVSAKLFLKRRNLKIKEYTRVKSEMLNYEERKMFDSLFHIMSDIQSELIL